MCWRGCIWSWRPWYNTSFGTEDVVPYCEGASNPRGQCWWPRCVSSLWWRRPQPGHPPSQAKSVASWSLGALGRRDQDGARERKDQEAKAPGKTSRIKEYRRRDLQVREEQKCPQGQFPQQYHHFQEISYQHKHRPEIVYAEL